MSTQTKNAWENKRLGCMWKRTKKDSEERYLTGVINLKTIPGFPDKDIPIIVFSNNRKEQENHPDLQVYLREDTRQKATQANQGQSSAPKTNNTRRTSKPPVQTPAPEQEKEPDPVSDPSDLI